MVLPRVPFMRPDSSNLRGAVEGGNRPGSPHRQTQARDWLLGLLIDLCVPFLRSTRRDTDEHEQPGVGAEASEQVRGGGRDTSTSTPAEEDGAG